MHKEGQNMCRCAQNVVRAECGERAVPCHAHCMVGPCIAVAVQLCRRTVCSVLLAAEMQATCAGRGSFSPWFVSCYNVLPLLPSGCLQGLIHEHAQECQHHSWDLVASHCAKSAVEMPAVTQTLPCVMSAGACRTASMSTQTSSWT
jgi:hypothetical protein